ncbi:uncharacterized protein LOC124156071 [Ischnura elegans]|uniref:uncharacterized protein LOC124156071 n=1 Tax=Ischnura elegans TaxID=197161 RepID=UPI001ED89A0A|nr:uncharacterized protein LOC124156071 [Ischnura elegans]
MYPYKPYELLCNVFQSSLYLTYEFYHKLLLYHSFLIFNCYEYSKSLKMAIPCFHSILPGNVTCYVESFPTSRNIGDDVFKSVNCYYSFITSQFFNLRRTLRSLTSIFWGLEGGDTRPPVDCEVWVGVVSEVHGGGAVGDRTPAAGSETRLGGEKEGNVKRENRGLGDGEECCSQEAGGATGEVSQSLPNEDECSGLLVDEYEHPSPDLFYVPTNVYGPGVLPEVFDSSYVGCSCSVGSLVCSENGLKCACVARSLGLNYMREGLLTEEKMSGPWHLPVVECGETCGCSAGCGNRRVQFGPLTTLQVFETAAEGEEAREGRVMEESVRPEEKPSSQSEPSSKMNKGLGLRTLAFVPRGSFVCEYAGEVIGRDEAMRRWRRDSSEGKGNYILALVESNGKISSTSMAPTVSGEKFATEGKVEGRVRGDKNYQVATYIDPTRIGNIGRYANHSCNPNCMTISVRFQGTVPHLCLFAARDILPGEEVTFDYAGVFKGESVGCVCNEEKIKSPSFGQKRKSFKLDGVCAKDMAEKRCNVSNKSQVLEQVYEKHDGGREVTSESHNCDKLAEYCSSESQVCLKVSGLSQCKDEQPGTSQIHHKSLSDSEKASKHGEMMLVGSRHEDEMIRTPCLCQDKNCRKFLPFTELWI